MITFSPLILLTPPCSPKQGAAGGGRFPWISSASGAGGERRGPTFASLFKVRISRGILTSSLTRHLARTRETVDLLLEACESHGCLPDLEQRCHGSRGMPVFELYGGFPHGVQSRRVLACKRWLPRQQQRCAHQKPHPPNNSGNTCLSRR